MTEGFEIGENHITANGGINKIEAVMQHFIVMHDEPQFFILELSAKKDDEAEGGSGGVRVLHKDIYYMDGCSQEEALTVMSRVGDLLYQRWAAYIWIWRSLVVLFLPSELLIPLSSGYCHRRLKNHSNRI